MHLLRKGAGVVLVGGVIHSEPGRRAHVVGQEHLGDRVVARTDRREASSFGCLVVK